MREELTLSVSETLVFGVASSLIATFIFIIAAEVFRRIVIPTFNDRVYRGARVDGKWEFEINEARLSLELSQKGDDISGVYRHNSDGETDSYTVTGRIKDSYFVATAFPQSKYHVDSFSLLFKLKTEDNALMLSGKLLSQGDQEDVHVTENMKFKRTNS